jgi:polyphenol oxidase
MSAPLTIIRPSFFGNGATLIAGLSTRPGGDPDSPFGVNLSYNVGDDPERVTENRRRFFGELKIRLDDLACMQQVHSATIARVENPGLYPECDAMITNRSGVFLCVTVADCVPVFILDRDAHALAAVHAGWRGTASRIASSAVQALANAYGAEPSRMEAFIGPSAGGCCYEVGKEVAETFAAAHVAVRDGKHFVDLKGINRSQLLASGIASVAVEVHAACTIHEGPLYQSFRRDGSKSGRMIGVAGFVDAR